ncbi:MAG TPA: cupin domain-containing protein [Chitinophaga sp.]|uniref:cupin domain-containing protein n=1 Tax=Chitinophaga sp. TaxID=1869181 RepID=UPI002BB1EABD|nr:cupin domain-containing protein [Chitinophaga sp.]HVI46217.1 cupin domain-containing protein [Chitinophaga sp.]
MNASKNKNVTLSLTTFFLLLMNPFSLYSQNKDKSVETSQVPSGYKQNSGIKGTTILKSSVSNDSSKEALIVVAEFTPGASTGKHFHEGDEYAVVMQGVLELWTDGSNRPQLVRKGDSYHNGRGTVHQARNVGKSPAKVIATFIVDKGKKLAIQSSDADK